MTLPRKPSALFAPVRRRTAEKSFGETAFRSVWNGRPAPQSADAS